MKFFFSFSSVIFMLLNFSISYAEPMFYQWGYNLCLDHIAKMERPDSLMNFINKSPEEQAAYCFDFLKKKHPDTAEKINFEVFTQGVGDGRYRQAQEDHD